MDRKDLLYQNNEKIKDLDERIQEIFYHAQGGEDTYEEDYEEEMWRLNCDPNYQASRYESEKRKLLLENRKLIYEIEKEAFDSEFDQMSKSFVSGIVSTDNESRIDTLERELMAKILVRHIVQKDVETPINIGIFGEWGEGKSSFLNLMQKEISVLNDANYHHICKTHIIKYDASEYDEKNKIWASLLSSMFEEFENKRGAVGKVAFTFHNIKKSFKNNIIKYIVNSVIFVISVIWLIIISGSENPIESIKNSFFSVVGIVPLVLFATNILIPFIRNQLEFIKPLSDRVLSFVNTPDYSQELGARENIKNTLNDLISVWIGGKNERIVMFIDELDRCSDKTITEFFDAMQLLLSVKGVTVVLSVNYKTVCYSLANNNKHYFSGDAGEFEKMEFGVEYLKKYINIPIHLLRKQNYEYYISDIMNKANGLQESDIELESANQEQMVKSENSKTLSENEMLFINKVLNWVNKKKHLTPREIKNIINMLILSKEIIFKSNLSKKDGCNIDFRKFLGWFFFHYFNRITSKNLLKIIHEINKDYLYSTVKEANDENKLDDIFCESERLSKLMFSMLDNVNLAEITKFKDISYWFVGDWIDN